VVAPGNRMDDAMPGHAAERDRRRHGHHRPPRHWDRPSCIYLRSITAGMPWG
jgi:hypothetical protein